MRNFAFLLVAAAALVFPGCGDEMPQTAGTSSSGGSSSSSGSVGSCTPWGTWKLAYTNDGTPCALTSDTVTITQNADGTAKVVFDGDDTMPMSMCGANPEPGVYSANATISGEGCLVELTSNSSYCFSGESQCESRNVKLVIDGDAATGTLTHKVCWCTPDPTMSNATAQRQP